MKTMVLFLTAYMILTGAALCWASLLKQSVMEGMVIATTFLLGDLFLFGSAECFSWGIILFCAVAAAGYILKIRQVCRDRKTGVNTAWILLSILFAGSLIIYYGDYIWHVDEFHQWAAAVKYMLETGRLPVRKYADFIGGYSQYFGTSLFHFFFQKIGGYSEGGMYASSALLTWIGLLLPFSNIEKKEWKKAAAYMLLLYVAIYSLYLYGTKNLYVDLPAAAWAGGCAAWWITDTEKKSVSQYITAVCAFVCTWFFKSHVGMLLVVLTVLFLSGWELLYGGMSRAAAHGISKESNGSSKKKAGIAVCVGIVLVLGAILLFIWDAGGKNGFASYAQGMIVLFEQKIKTVTISFITCLFGTPLSGRSELKLTFFPMLLLILTLTGITERFGKEKAESSHIKWLSKEKYCMLYECISSVLFLGTVFAAYLFIFSKEEAEKSAGITRYMSVIVIYLFVISLVRLLKSRNGTVYSWIQRYAVIALLFFFGLGLNESYIPNHTAFNKKEAVGYKDIKSARIQIEKIKKIISEDDKVYFLYQDNSNEYPTNAALYYLDHQSSNYLEEPWKFTEKGSITRLAESDKYTIEDFPTILTEGGYTYVWIYNSDAYLEKNLPKVIECDEIVQKALYKAVYDENGVIIRMERTAYL